MVVQRCRINGTQKKTKKMHWQKIAMGALGLFLGLAVKGYMDGRTAKMANTPTPVFS